MLQVGCSALHVLALQELPGRLWDGKEAVLEAVGALAAACPELLLAAPAGSGGGEGPLAGRVVAALVDAASKKKSAYKKAALEQLDAGGWMGGQLLCTLCSALLGLLSSPGSLDWGKSGLGEVWKSPQTSDGEGVWCIADLLGLRTTSPAAAFALTW